VESEAEHVRWIFRMFADGHSMGEIATILTENKIMRRNGETAWTRTNVQKILTNEKYVGDALSQKSYTIDCLTHERRKNSGEKTKYYLRDCHDAIIDRDTWDRVHLELARRSAETKGRHSGKKYAKKYCFSDLLTCPYCGGKYKRTIWKIGEKSVGVWRCGNRIDHGSRICSRGASLHEDKLQNTVVAVINDMIENPEKVEEAIMETMNQFRTKITEIDTQLMDINTELERISARRDDILTVITGEAFEQFKTELEDLNSQELELKSKAEKLQIKRDNVQFSIKKAVTAKELFSNMLPLREFDDITIPKLIKRIDVTDKEHIKVIFCGGVETEMTVEK
ncbi:MAG: recombinase family protein, partial [Oscillospiraceae bacterium]|nr:recombinase family protein [Oscillospiraceae bacterium]